MSFARPRALVGAVAAGCVALAGTTATSGTSQAASSSLVDIQILSFNDFHGNLEPPSGSSGRLVIDHALAPGATTPTDVTSDSLAPPGLGGVAYLATQLKQARVGHPNTLTVAAGDLIGASPFVSAAFHDEPSMEALNDLGLDVSSVGNHEFDEGYRELLRMQDGGCLDDGAGVNGQNSCALHIYEGANFQYLAANVKYDKTNRTILPAYAIKEVGGAKIGFIGMTLRDTPTIVTASGVAGLKFQNEIKTANDLVPELKKQGVKAIIVLIHQGGTPGQQTWYDQNGNPYQVAPSYDAACENGSSLAPDSPILPIARRLDPEIDMLITGHTHQPYVCQVRDPAGQPRLLTSASSFGRLFTETELSYDVKRGDIVRRSIAAENQLVTRNVTPDPFQTQLIAAYKAESDKVGNVVVGQITCDVLRGTPPPGSSCPGVNAAGESPLGDLIADAQLADPSTVPSGGTPPLIAFMNPGGIRADLTYAPSPLNSADAPGRVLYSEAFTVQPFNNYLVSMDLTGQGIYDLLAQQVTGSNAGSAKKLLQVSNGFSYTLTPTGAADGSATLNGTPIDKAATYRIVANSFLSDGGDNFAAFRTGTNKFFGGLDLDAFTAFLGGHLPYAAATPTRVSGSS